MFDIDWVDLRRSLGMFVFPPAGLVLVVVMGLLVRRRLPRLGGVLAWGGALALWLASLPIVADALYVRYADVRPIDRSAARSADAMVILGGGMRNNAVEFGGE